ncbi:MAG TPA: integrase arm-type DNA-binding domain-containing protein [Steroidobacteraceae bacterium]|jgi:integrase
MPLSDRQIRAFKPKPKVYKESDGDGMYMRIEPSGSKVFRQKYYLHGIEKSLSCGVYPATSLTLARAKARQIREQLAAGIDPSAARKAAKAAGADTFQALGNEWLELQTEKLSKQTIETNRSRLTTWVYPAVGSTPMRSLEADPPAMLAMLRRIELRGKLETAARIKSVCSQIFRFAIATGRASRDPTLDLRGALKPAKEKHLAAVVEPLQVGELLRAVWSYTGAPLTEIAMKLSAYTVVRPGELRAAEWSEINLDAAEWRIPSGRMKMKQPHFVPLSTQAIELFQDAAIHSASGRFVFPTSHDPKRCMSENTIRAALARLGYDGENGNPEHTAHGWRSTASTLLNEAGYNSDLIELQLAHKSSDDVRRAYNRAQRIEERRAMVQWYADKLDELRTSKALR